jgi:aryl sulfotransferase
MDQFSQLPQKTREYQNFAMDSTFWNDFKFRGDDIFISSYGKAGTTWIQQIVAQFIFEGVTDDKPIGDISQWVEFRIPTLNVKLPMIEVQDHRRFLKTHLPVDALVFSPEVKYIYVARDGRDVLWSMFNHHVHLNNILYDGLKALPVQFGPIIEPPRTQNIREYFLDWLNEDGFPFWAFWENIRTWWDIRHLPNVHFVHFQNLKNDMEGEMEIIGAYLGYDVGAITKGKWDDYVRQCTFTHMKNNAPNSTPMGGALWDGGAQVFVNKGTNKRWTDTLTADDIEQYEKRALEELGPECAYWLATGIGA